MKNKLISIFILIIISIICSSNSFALFTLEDDSGSILKEDASYLKTESDSGGFGPFYVTDTGTYTYKLIDCQNVTDSVGVTVSAAGKVQNFTVVNCPGGSFNFTESGTLTNSIGISTGNDITISSGKTVTGTYNIFGDVAKSGDGTYSDGSSTSKWNTDPLFTSTYTLKAGSPAISLGVNICTGVDTPLTGCTGSGTGIYTDFVGNKVPTGVAPEAGCYEAMKPGFFL